MNTNKPEPTTEQIQERHDDDDCAMSEGTLIEPCAEDYFDFTTILLSRLKDAENENKKLNTMLEAATYVLRQAGQGEDMPMRLVKAEALIQKIGELPRYDAINYDINTRIVKMDYSDKGGAIKYDELQALIKENKHE